MVCYVCIFSYFVFFKQKAAYEMRISDWSSDVCSSDLLWEIIRTYPMHRTSSVAGNIRLECIKLLERGFGASTDVELAVDDETLEHLVNADAARSEERRVGKECGSKCRSRWSP